MIIQREAVRAFLLTPENEILLLRYPLPERNEYFWIAPGGGAEPGETIEQTLRRELYEKLGLEQFAIGPLVWRRKHTFNWENRRLCQCERYYIVHVDRFEPCMSDIVESQNLDEFRWWQVTDLAQSTERLTPLSLANIVARYLKHGPQEAVLEVEVLVD